MQLAESDLILITGATGLVGSHLAEQARQRQLRVRALCREGADTTGLNQWDVEVVPGNMDDHESLQAACKDVTVVMHCAAKVGDWGPMAEYRRVNVDGTRALLDAMLCRGTLRKWIQISSLGVYAGTDHYGTDETTRPDSSGIDGYTLSKVESERLVSDYIQTRNLPAVILRPGFIYGPRDRTVLPRLMERLRTRSFAYLGNHDKLMNNTFVGNLCSAVWLAIEHDHATGEVFNIRDPRAVTKKEFIETICRAADYPIPTKVVPLHIARLLSWHLEKIWKLLHKQQAPVVNRARIKFLGRNLDFCIDKATQQLGYERLTDFRDAMVRTVDWFLSQKA